VGKAERGFFVDKGVYSLWTPLSETFNMQEYVEVNSTALTQAHVYNLAFEVLAHNGSVDKRSLWKLLGWHSRRYTEFCSLYDEFDFKRWKC